MRYLLLLGCAGALFGQGSLGTETKPKVEEYEVHGQLQNAAIGAEYMVHSYSRGEQMYIAKNYLVVEVAIFPVKDQTLAARHTDFSLRLNGKKEALVAEAPSLVVAEMEHPEMQSVPGGLRTEAGGGIGNTRATIGGPPVNPNPIPGRPPQPGSLPPPVPIPRDNPGGVQKEPVNPAELLQQTALVEDPHHTPFSGYLFFPYKGKAASIKSLELLCEDVVLKLK